MEALPRSREGVRLRARQTSEGRLQKTRVWDLMPSTRSHPDRFSVVKVAQVPAAPVQKTLAGALVEIHHVSARL